MPRPAPFFLCAFVFMGCEEPPPTQPLAAPAESSAETNGEAAPEDTTAEESLLPTGLDHLGLAVRDLEATKNFFVEALGFRVTGEDADYPSAFVVNGHARVTLWQVEDPDSAVAFDRRNNVGLHHFALAVSSDEVLDAMHERIGAHPGVTIEFAPEPLGGGPSRHMMFRDPSGIRMELIHRAP